MTSPRAARRDAVAETLGPRPASPSLGACRTALGVFTLLFFVPSLAIRYWAQHDVAQICGLLLIAVALVAGLVAGLRVTSPYPRAVRLFAFGAGVASGAFCAAAIGQARRLDELTLALAALAFLLPAVVVSRVIELVAAGAGDLGRGGREGRPRARGPST